MFVSTPTLTLTYGTIVSDVDATFWADGAYSGMLLFFLVFVTACAVNLLIFFPMMVSWSSAPLKKIFVIIGSALTAIFMTIALVTFFNSSENVEIASKESADESSPLNHYASFADAAEAVFGEDAKVHTPQRDSEGALEVSARLYPESYDSEEKAYSGVSVVTTTTMNGAEITTYDVVISLDGTVTFTEMVSEESANSVNGGEQ